MAISMNKEITDGLWSEVNTKHSTFADGRPYPFREWPEEREHVEALLEATNAYENGIAFKRTLEEFEKGQPVVRLNSMYVRELLEA